MSNVLGSPVSLMVTETHRRGIVSWTVCDTVTGALTKRMYFDFRSSIALGGWKGSYLYSSPGMGIGVVRALREVLQCSKPAVIITITSGGTGYTTSTEL